jgi:hypothetical protein
MCVAMSTDRWMLLPLPWTAHLLTILILQLCWYRALDGRRFDLQCDTC